MLDDDMAGTTADLQNTTFEPYTDQNVATTSEYESNNMEPITKITPTIQDLSHLFEHTFSGMTYKQCTEWQSGTQHVYFHIANVLLLIAFLIPYKPFYSILCGRCAIIFACIFMIMFNYLIECSLDGVIWYAVFLVINSIYSMVLIYQLRPIRFEKEIEQAYVALFKPLNITRLQFKKVLSCMKTIRTIKYQEIYAKEKVTKVESLSLVLSGKLVVSQNQRALHIVFQHQFLDSPEWFGVSTDDYFQVSIMAMEESRVLIWHRDKLRLSIIGEPYLQTVFDHVLGKDVVKKLMQVTQVNETLSTSNGYVQTAYDDNASEDKPMLHAKTNGTTDDQGITALINRQMQDEHVPLLGRHQSKPYMLQKQSAFSTNHRLNSEYKTSPC